jgi:hypothetical protein
MEYYLIVQDMGYYNDIIHAITTDEDEALRLYNELQYTGVSIVRYSVNAHGKVIQEKSIMQK